MAGTAAGALKAAQARSERAAQRRLLREQLSAALGPPLQREQAQRSAPLEIKPLPTVEQSPTEQPTEQDRSALVTVGEPLAVLQAVNAQAVDVSPLVPVAQVVAGDILTGKIKASPAVRANLAIDVLKLASRPAVPSAPSGMADAVAALAKALGFRQPRTFEGGEVVAPTVTTEG